MVALFHSIGCERGWIPSNRQGCYKFVERSASWNDAQTTCGSFDSTLAIIDTAEEAARLAEIRKEQSMYIKAVTSYQSTNGRDFRRLHVVR